LLLFLHRRNRNHKNRKEDPEVVNKAQSPTRTSLRTHFREKYIEGQSPNVTLKQLQSNLASRQIYKKITEFEEVPYRN
jgi:hypothetical protein